VVGSSHARSDVAASAPLPLYSSKEWRHEWESEAHYS
jgi:hypothetical protein